MAIDTDSLVSMNMWGLTPDFLTVLEEGFKEFFEKEVAKNPLKAEYLIPTFIGELLAEGKMSVKVLRSNDTWYGMTYHEDVAAVKDSFKKMLEKGVYKADLFADFRWNFSGKRCVCHVVKFFIHSPLHLPFVYTERDRISTASD